MRMPSMNRGRFLAFATLLWCFGVSASESIRAPQYWLFLIQKDFEASCKVERFKVGTVVAGYNGLREEQWFLHTCHGDVEYWVSYYPESAFPDRATPYEVRPVTLAGGGHQRPE